MKSALVVLTVLGATLTETQAKQPNLFKDDISDANYYIEGIRGFWDGYTTAFYKNSKKTNKGDCLNDETTKNILSIIDFFEHNPDMSKLFPMFGQVVQIADNLQNCGLKSSFEDIEKFCYANEDNCSTTTLMNNLTKNMLSIVGKVTEAGEVLKEFPDPDVENFYAQTNQLGSEIGSIVRTVSGYKA